MQRVHHTLIGLLVLGMVIGCQRVNDLLDMSSFGFVLSTPRITKSPAIFYTQFPTFLAGCSLIQRVVV
jgi:hypothetical protein